MKKIIILILVASMGFIIYYFIIEQFKGVALSKNENIFLSVLYLIIGICILILVRFRNIDNKSKR